MRRHGPPILILGIETSCDETAAAVVADGRVVLSNVVASQAELHAPYGGVFPELASRQHVRDIVPVIQQALAEAGVVFDDLAAVAVTHGPGLAGSLLVGVNAAKGICLASGLPLIGVNHMAGHLYSHWLHDQGVLRTAPSRPIWETVHSGDPGRPALPAESGVMFGPPAPGAAWPADPPFPLLLLTVSGGHTELVLVRAHGDLTLLGQTLDDAAGEAFDKAARMLGLGYPGGPAIQAAAEGVAAASETDIAARLARPFPVAETPQALDFSFSGLKTAMLRRVEASRAAGLEPDVTVLAAGFQTAVVKALVGRAKRAIGEYPQVRALLLAGGVAANGPLRAALAADIDRPVLVPPLALCTDNAAMIAAAGFFTWEQGRRDGLGLDVLPGLGW